MSSGRMRRQLSAPTETSDADDASSDTPTKRGSRTARAPSVVGQNGDHPPPAKRPRLSSKADQGDEPEWSNPGVNVQDICQQLFTTVRNCKDKSGRELAEVFLQLPSQKLYPDYDEIIKNPIAMNIIQAKLQTGKYKAVAALKVDIETLFNNAKTYNRNDSQVYQDAVFLLELFNRTYNQLKEEAASKTTAISNAEDPHTHTNGSAQNEVANDPPPVKRGPGRPRKSEGAKAKGDNKSMPQSGGVKTEGTSDLANLFEAIEKGDVPTVLKLLKTVPNVNVLNEAHLFGENFTWSPLHAASYFGQDAVVDVLIEKGADVEFEDTWFRGRALAWAAYGGHITTCRILVKKYHADRNAKNDAGQIAHDLLSEPDSEEWRSILVDDGKVSKPPESGKRRRGGGAKTETDTSGDDQPLTVRLRKFSSQPAQSTPLRSTPKPHNSGGDSGLKLKVSMSARLDADAGPATPTSPTRVKIKIPQSTRSHLSRSSKGVRRGSINEDDIDIEAISDGESSQAVPQPATLSQATAAVPGITNTGTVAQQPASTFISNGSSAAAPAPVQTPVPAPTISRAAQETAQTTQASVSPANAPPRFIISIGIVSNDDIVRRVLPMDPDIDGHAMRVQQGARSLNLRLLLRGYENNGVQYTVTGRQVVRQQVDMQYYHYPTLLKFTPAGPHVFDCLAYLEGGLNSFEFEVLAVVGGVGPAVSQAASLFLNRE
ncbi:hypothetical protein HDV00_003516 [Rhizophlyctis rosea]|nr:hypothetical protein HDV00_003516 [Rhizophlyctis rosea]